jgi:hypothetical protein
MTNIMRVGNGQKLHLEWKDYGATRCGIGITLNTKRPRRVTTIPTFDNTTEAATWLTNQTNACQNCLEANKSGRA